MSRADDLQREIVVLRDRMSQLSAASVRISASLDLDTVLREIVETARVLTGARYGAITTTGDAGQLQDFVTAGFSADEHRSLLEWPDGLRLFEHIRTECEAWDGRDPVRAFPTEVP